MVTALILSGGTGNRMGADIPKQYLQVAGRSVISYCISTFLRAKEIDAVWVVADKQWHNHIHEIFHEYDKAGKFAGFSEPGENRQLSIYNGIRDIKTWHEKSQHLGSEVVMIHDAARPLLTEADISDYVSQLGKHEGLMPVLAAKDTVYVSEDGEKINSLIPRDNIYFGQAPELFLLDKYLDANQRLIVCHDGEIEKTSEIFSIKGSSEVAYKAGMDVVLVPGSETNFKITTPADFGRFKELVEKRVLNSD